MFSIITVTYNAASHIAILTESLKLQKDHDFEWVIVDGKSTDNTVEIIHKHAEGLNYKIVSERDFGIYDAFNKGIKLIGSKYYMVLGADDYLLPDASKVINEKINDGQNFDICVSSVIINNSIVPARWEIDKAYLGAHQIINSHSVAMLINKDLHDKVGLYSLRYLQCADALFIKSLVALKELKVIFNMMPIGCFSIGGVSTVNVARGLCEGFLIQLETEKSKSLQFLFFIARLVKNFFKLTK
ncbi:MAG: glycosyltransferase [Candidatus Methylopumilus sp.]|nr:glycosyltransferase [Candidatus Methylopumilus sp.]